MSTIDNEALRVALEKLQGTSPEGALDATLRQVVDAVGSLFPVDGAGLMFLDDSDALRYVAASDEASRALEQAQEQQGHGPCVDALLLDTPIATNDIASDTRWPRLAAEVVPHGVVAVLGMPVHVGSGAVGSLDVYCSTVHDWDRSEIDALQVFARLIDDVVASALFARSRGRLAEQLQYALDNRVVIERAIGVVMGRSGDVDPVAAFNRLRKVARSERRRVADVATDVLAGTLDV